MTQLVMERHRHRQKQREREGQTETERERDRQTERERYDIRHYNNPIKINPRLYFPRTLNPPTTRTTKNLHAGRPILS